MLNLILIERAQKLLIAQSFFYGPLLWFLVEMPPCTQHNEKQPQEKQNLWNIASCH